MTISKHINKNIIIGAATGYQKKDLFNFVETARKVFVGRIFLIINNKINSETNHYLNKKKVEIFFTKLTSRTIYKDRYQIYLDIVKNNKNAENIMLTDTKDVIFQSDPFLNNNLNKLNFFLEDRLIKNCATNIRWILRAYGNKVYNQIKNKRISCSGVTIGNKKEILKYCKQMVQEIKNNKYYSLNPFNKGSDQGNHNIIVNSSKFKMAKKFVNTDSFVVNLSNSKENILKYTNGKFKINKKTISVIHQYDSHKLIEKKVQNLIFKL